ncbi:ABC transporter permease [Mucilaginibacter agri]|uniref:FtsX-like permease family protein n=1 Tax=Mucilaginibacter agri TaxID=2695265 RepID=A0A966DTG6_9SPHI|nr:ABC transporter permease [Mucilaginibacter agri]NCD70645.1 FtsX-like permease family protein [Mucilaginibacter agri]
MIRNLIKTAFRSLLKNRTFTILNVLGLTLGLAACLLIVFYIADELSYDNYNTKADRIYRVNTDFKYNDVTTSYAIVAPPVAAALKHDFPEIEQAARLTPSANTRVKKGDENLQEYKVVYSDPAIFSIFTLPFIAGDAATALKEPHTVVINETTALKYFGSTNVIGRSLTLINDSTDYKVTGVMHDMPIQSHFNFDFFLSMASNPRSTDNNFNHFNYQTYILLKPDANPQRLEAKFGNFMKLHLNTSTFNYDKFASNGNFIRLNLTPLKDIHLHSNRQRELGVNGDISYIYIFGAIALFILLIACINFMNLSTARSANRAREVGVRKVLGSPRIYLIYQFLAESILITLFAAVLALLLAWVLLHSFNEVAGKNLTVTSHNTVYLLPALLVIVIIVGVIAGSYPAFFLSAFKPVNVLNGKLTGLRGGGLRSALIVFQFAITIFLIIGTLTIYNQLNYIQNKNLGFDRNHVLIVKNVNLLEDPNILKAEVKKLSGVIDASVTGFLPTADNRQPANISGEHSSSAPFMSELWEVDADYLGTLGMNLVSGRNFSDKMKTDSAGILINETAAKMLGYMGNNILNKKVFYTDRAGLKHEYQVLGVVKDFNFNSLRDNITPLAMILAPDFRASLNIRIESGNIKALMTQVEKKWNTVSANQRFEYSFMDQDFDTLYRTEQRTGDIFLSFTFLAILIACLGLFGLAACTAEQRSKEIGIRKILGANVARITTLLTKDFIRLVIVAIVIASPLAWLAMQHWLQGFAYRQEFSWWILLIAGLGAILIAVITVSFQSIKVAVANPIKSLRRE